MGQKVNPHGLRVGVIKDWDSKWYAEGDFADCLIEDYNIRKFLKKRLYSAGVSKIEIERASDKEVYKSQALSESGIIWHDRDQRLQGAAGIHVFLPAGDEGREASAGSEPDLLPAAERAHREGAAGRGADYPHVGQRDRQDLCPL